MVKDYHNKIQCILSSIVDQNKDKFRKGFCGNKKIDINHPTKKNRSIIYYPDYVIISKNGNYFIFQILDSQGDMKAYTIANVIEAYLSEQVKKLYFVIKDNKTRDEVIEITETILSKIEDITRGSVRSPLKVFYITVSDSESDKAIKKILEDTLIGISNEVDKRFD